jgi:predicted N-acetyltransferase YhbS
MSGSATLEKDEMDPSITVRLERPADIAQIRSITTAAFSASQFGHNGEAELIERLRRSCAPFVSLVAEVFGQLSGHVLFTPVTLEDDEVTQGMGLGPISVLPGFQRQGIGARLIESGLNLLDADRHEFVVVLGDPGFYGRFGFRPARLFGITCEFDFAPADAFQVRWLRSAGTLRRSGRVRYHPAFSQMKSGAQPDEEG